MIVWGGGKDDGAAYNPMSNSWTSIANAPIKLGSPTAQWTGTEMIVWGGTEAFVGATARGFRYTRGSNSWSEMTSLNAPGARYNPANDTWKTMAFENQPSGTKSHKAVWTGQEMVIWAGHTTTYVSARGVYYPQLDPLPELIFGGPGGSFEEPVADPGNN